MTKLDAWIETRQTLFSEVMAGLEPLIQSCRLLSTEEEKLYFPDNPEDFQQAKRLYEAGKMIGVIGMPYDLQDKLAEIYKGCKSASTELTRKTEILKALQEEQS